MNTERFETQPDEDAVMDYLRNRLSESSAIAFERYCLEHPEFAREVERELALKRGFRELGGSGYRRRTPLVRLALAATLLLPAFLGVWYYTARNAGRTETLVVATAAGELPANLRSRSTTRISLIRLRQSEDLGLPIRPGLLELRLVPDFPPAAQGYDAHIEAWSPAARMESSIHITSVEADGSAKLYFSAEQLVGKTLSISIWPAGSPAASQTFRARIIDARPAQ